MEGLIDVLVEIVMAIVQAVMAVLEFVAESVPFLVDVAIAAASIVAYIVSPSARAKLRARWQGNSWMKFLHLGFSGTCLVALVALSCWFFWPSGGSEIPVASGPAVKQGEERVFQLKYSRESEKGTNRVVVSVKKGGLRELVNWQSVSD